MEEEGDSMVQQEIQAWLSTREGNWKELHVLAEELNYDVMEVTDFEFEWCYIG